LTLQLLIDHLHLGPQDFHLWPDYDADSLGMHFDQISRSRSNGQLVKRLVRDERGRLARAAWVGGSVASKVFAHLISI
jgi:hypothetical protein